MTAEELSHVATGAAIEVHRHLGPGLLESAYEASFSFELANRGIQHERQKAVPLVYKGMRLDCGYRLDVLVDREVIVELKSVKALAPIDSARMLSYLRLTGCSLGLIINFNVPILKDGIRRIINTFHNPSRPRGDSTM